MNVKFYSLCVKLCCKIKKSTDYNNQNTTKDIIETLQITDNQNKIVKKYNQRTGDMIKYKIGDGTFGTIYFYKCKNSCLEGDCNRCFVVKKMKIQSFWNKKETRLQIQKFYREYEIGITLFHKNIRKTLAYDNKNNSIIFENCFGMDFLDYANDYSDDNTKPLLKYFNQILDGVCHLHSIGIAHLDLKLENIVLDTHTHIIKLIDFGEAVRFKDDKTMFEGTRGTIQYMPPEAVAMRPYSAVKTDIWCCGIILYNLFYNIQPWEIANGTDYRYNIFSLEIIKNKLHPAIFPTPKNYYSNNDFKIIKSVFKMLLQCNPLKRKSLNMVKSVFILMDI